MKRTTREWVNKAEADYRAAGRLHRGSDPLHDIVCFHCQQCAEKYLKGLLEELGLAISARELHLTGIVSEHGFQGQSHWLMFLFEVTKILDRLPPAHREGRFEFFSRDALPGLRIPQTDL